MLDVFLVDACFYMFKLLLATEDISHYGYDKRDTNCSKHHDEDEYNAISIERFRTCVLYS